MFLNSLKGWAVGGSGILITTIDGGNSWQTQSVGTTNAISSIFFINDNIGWLSEYGGGIIKKSTDGGISWTQQPTGFSNNINSIFFIDQDNGWVAGGPGTGFPWSLILKTTNGGTTWTSYSSGLENPLMDIHFTDLNNGWAAGPELLKTTDGGTSWSIYTELKTYGYEAVHFTNPNVGWAVGFGSNITKTTNAGATFINEDENYSPQDFTLFQNYPNPFNPTTTIKFSLPEDSRVMLVVYNLIGEEVTTLLNEYMSAGYHHSEFNSGSLSSGVYIYKLSAIGNGKAFTSAKKFVLMK
jgi:photosystem II stability/assembly factor-like uncharacterized protein